jgi:hypothetical protein
MGESVYGFPMGDDSNAYSGADGDIDQGFLDVVLAHFVLGECGCVDIGVNGGLYSGKGFRDHVQHLHSPPKLLWSGRDAAV